MNCPKYQALSVQEKTVTIGKLIHLLQNSEEHFDVFASVIRQAEQTGHFEDVTILPENTDNE